MAISKPIMEVRYRVVLELDEKEARALDALVGYGYKPFEKWFSGFLDGFYKKLGKTYMSPHYLGLESFFKTIETQVLPQLGQIDKS